MTVALPVTIDSSFGLDDSFWLFGIAAATVLILLSVVLFSIPRVAVPIAVAAFALAAISGVGVWQEFTAFNANLNSAAGVTVPVHGVETLAV